MTIELQHDFTGSDGSSATSAAPTTGSNMVAWPSGDWTIKSNRAFPDTGSGIRSNQTISSADYTIRAVIRPVTNADGSIEIIGRCSIAGGTGYSVQLATSGSGTIFSWLLYKYTGGFSPTTLGSFSFTPTAGVNFTLELVMSGSSISVTINGSTVLGPITDATYGAAGVAAAYGGTYTSTTGYHFDSFVVDVAGGGGGGSVFRPYF